MSPTQLETDDDLRRRVEQRVNKRREFMMHASAFGLVVALMWVVFLTIPALSAFWWILVATTLGWGAGLAGHAIDTYFQIGPPAERVDEAVWSEMRERFGPDWRATATKADYNTAQHRLSRSTNKLKELLIHGSVFVLINVMIWVLWGVVFAPFFGLAGSSPALVPLLVTLGWGIGMAFHAADVLTSLNRGRDVENAVERERDRIARLDGVSKRKNEQRQTSMRVGDDGELVELIDDEPTYDQKAKRG